MSITNYIVDHIPKTTPYNRRPGYSMTPEYITIHSTGNPTSTARNERAWLTNPNNNVTASWHIVVDEKEAIEAIPLNEVAWHAGDGGNGTGNRKSIGIEICESGDRQKTLQNAAELVAKLLKERGWGVDRLRRHYDWSGKICPRIFYDNGKWTGWEQFKEAVQKELFGGDNMTQDKNQPSDWAKEAWEWAKKEGITDGTDPQRVATREEVITMLYRYYKKVSK
ncbi:N-acetylmuramoyl-L-alanine amidase CwlA [Thermoclostridium stercorarium subsp. stercorarium DSM 8532]|uniref:N-acetylmuramoyl-L-alanine amidase n=1 Tax=Thermoclostridium stercorarium (strain ATCC 35414 / DSM 8532 / NCIMB 11754) TaxID=1121335 RepID=L7VPF7_THES1|nr:N-acetylmuramoyl-L-alanine amidase [Thermoclostridium stercorarium]AGC67453.1 N-acetylmuramoyl-L-alanine amidase CwlA [Thermoclostridium stercorarium subsp. stercorarium DSM 8532]AGI38513.1 N-acetylmuramoyl-L-alanine amidase [Thermoclostridium stercorarium subsp. stercorarium DSM 8532]